MLSNFIPIAILILLATVTAGGILVLSHFLGPKKPSSEKLSTYECGVSLLMKSRVRLSIKFYLIAVLFVLFDIEVIFLYPWAIVFKKLLLHNGNFIFVEMLIFLAVLSFGLFYVWKKGALEWD